MAKVKKRITLSAGALGLHGRLIVGAAMLAGGASFLVVLADALFGRIAPEAALVRGLTINIGVALVATLGASLLAAVLVETLLKPMKQLTRLAQVAATGDLSVDMRAKGGDEFARLSNSMGQMVSRMRGRFDRVQRLAFVDPVTKLPNRALCQRVVEKVLGQCRTQDSTAALLYMDIDRFKAINDTLGHAAGDSLLELFAERVKTVVQARDLADDAPLALDITAPLLARLGGDEFALLLPKLRDQGEALRVCNRVLHALEEPFQIGETVLTVSASIGIAMMPLDGDSFDALIRNADIAMYHAKDVGRNNAQFFRQDLNERVLERLMMEGQLREALAQGQFEVFYQPQVEARTGVLVGAEALVRWRHPTAGLIAPGVFIKIAEEAGLIYDIGAAVLRAAVRQARLWADAGLSLRVAVNVSPRQLARGEFVDLVATVLQQARLSPSLLELEVSEATGMSEDPAVHAVLDQLRALGVKLAMDDFGSGYSNLATLKRLKIDRLKIDRSVIVGLEESEESRILVSTILVMARTFGYEVVAEGVENAQQAEILADAGCTLLQGYHVSCPVDVAAFEVFRRGAPLAAVESGLLGIGRRADPYRMAAQ